MWGATISNRERKLSCPSQNRTCAFYASGSSTILPELYLPCSDTAHGAILRLLVRLFHCPVLISPLTPSSGLPALTGHYSGYSFTTSQSDYPAGLPPPCLFSLLETCSIAPAGFSQVSDINSLITRHDLRPRPVSVCSPFTHTSLLVSRK